MQITSSYSVKIKDYSKVFTKTVDLYRGAVDFYIEVIMREWAAFSAITQQTRAVNLAEEFSVVTAGRRSVRYDFGKDFYKFPSYLRRSAIAEAYGKVKSCKSNLANWETADWESRGKAPSAPKAGYAFPCLYRDNMYRTTDEPYTARIKVFIRNTWDWLTVRLKKSDVDYIMRHCFPVTDDGQAGALRSRRICPPTLRRRGKEWFLDFPVEEKIALTDTQVMEQTIIAVDLGINSACTLSVMRSDGTVVGREFLSLPAEKDSLEHAINRIKKAQQHGNHKVPRLWAKANGINNRIAVLTAQFIADKAVLYKADVIVFEHLDRKGKLRGSKKQRLHLWRSRYVQAMTANKAHRLGIRVSHICAWGTSKLAYDGSGTVLRGKDAGLRSYSVCKFASGKIYNCDLSASYNIGARYFVREITKSLPETARLQLPAKVPGACKRSTCTLSTLISLNAVLAA